MGFFDRKISLVVLLLIAFSLSAFSQSIDLTYLYFPKIDINAFELAGEDIFLSGYIPVLIKTQEEYDLLVSKIMIDYNKGKESGLSIDEFPFINFNKKSLIIRPEYRNSCKIEYYFDLRDDKVNKQYILTTVAKQTNDCMGIGFYPGKLIFLEISKVPDDYTLTYQSCFIGSEDIITNPATGNNIN